MPLPFLPPELISEIISYLRNEDDVDEQVRDGKAVSLVCKSWKRLGQALRWRFLYIKPARIPSVYRHFAQYPHLAKSVRRLVYAQLKEEQSSEESCGRMAEIVTNLVNLEAFEILGQLGQHLSSVVQAASTLLKLRVFAISSNEENDTTDDVIRSFSTGFNNLRHLHFRLVRLNASNREDDRHPDVRNLRLVHLTIAWSCDLTEMRRVGKSFLRILDPTALETVGIGCCAVSLYALEWLLECPRLVRLRIELVDVQVPSAVPEVLSILPRLPSLQYFRLAALPDRADETCGVDRMPIALEAVLARFPPSLRRFMTQNLDFFDYHTIPARPSPRMRHHALCGSRLRDNEEGKVVPLSIWGEKVEGGGGRIEWYRAPNEDVDKTCEYHTSFSIPIDLDR